MKRILTAVVLIPLVLLVVFRAPLWLFAVVVGIVILLCLHEYLTIVEQYQIKPLRWTAYLSSVVLVTALFIATAIRFSGERYAVYLWVLEPVQLAAGVLLPLIFGIPVIFRRDLKMALTSSGVSAFGVLYITMSLELLIPMRWTPGCAILLIFTLLSVWAGDIAAYYAGRAFGRHKLAPVVSPNKTWEGAVTSLAASVAVAGLVFHFQQPIQRAFIALPLNWPSFRHDDFLDLRLHLLEAPNLFLWLSMGLVANIAAQFGDLFESAIKRGAQIKDSGALLPGHGGILDRIDALLFAIPAVWYYALLIGFP